MKKIPQDLNFHVNNFKIRVEDFDTSDNSLQLLQVYLFNNKAVINYCQYNHPKDLKYDKLQYNSNPFLNQSLVNNMSWIILNFLI